MKKQITFAAIAIFLALGLFFAFSSDSPRENVNQGSLDKTNNINFKESDWKVGRPGSNKNGPPTSGNGWTINGSKIFMDDSKAYISADPHTIRTEEWVEFEVMTKQFTGDIDVALGFDTDKLRPLEAEYFSTTNFTVEESYTCEYDFNYTANYFWCYVAANNSMIVFEGPYDRGNIQTKTAWWNVTKSNDWREFAGSWNSVNYNLNETNKWWYRDNIPMSANVSRTFRVKMKDLDVRDDFSKYWLAVKPSSQTFAQAKSAGNLYLLDPWVNATAGNWITIDLENETWENQTFTANGTWVFPEGVSEVAVLVIAGGGGGSTTRGAGGGAGGYIFNESYPVSGNVTVVIGEGGIGGVGVLDETQGRRGSNSSFGTLSANGGGGGVDTDGNTCLDLLNGASGGGGGRCVTGPKTRNDPGNATPLGQGFNGGYGYFAIIGARGGGGGGGAGHLGYNASNGLGGLPGEGLIFNGVNYALGGWGDSATSTGGTGGDSPANTGYGGNSTDSNPGSAGGSGVVIVFWQVTPPNFPQITLNSPSDNLATPNSTVEFNVTVVSNTVSLIQNVSLLINGTINETNTSGVNGTYFFNKTFSDGGYNWTIVAFNNESKESTSATRDFEIDTNPPNVTITSPETETFGVDGKTLFLNWTYEDVHNNTCIYEYDGSNSSINCTDTSTSFVYNSPVNNLTFYANDTFGNERTVVHTWTYLLEIVNETFEDTVAETTSTDFEFVLSYNSTYWTTVTSVLNYNGTEYTGTQVGTGDIITFTRSIDIPAISGNDTNSSFFWNVSLTNSTTTLYALSSTHNQTITPVTFGLCGAGDSPVLNISTYKASDLSSQINATFAANWQIYDSSGTGAVVKNESYGDATEANSTWYFCLTPNSTNYTVTMNSQADATGFTPTNYYLTNASFDGSLNNIQMYLLNDSLATITQIQVVDKAYNGVADILVFVQAYDIFSDTYFTVDMANTADDGTDLLYLNWFDTWYKFILLQNGVPVKTTAPKKISSTPEVIELFDTGAFDFEKFGDVVYSLTFNETSKVFTLVYVMPSAEVTSGHLKVIKRNVTDDYTICDVGSSSTSATIFCDVTAEGNGTFIARFYAQGSLGIIDTLTALVGVQAAIYDALGNLDGTTLAILLAGIITSFFLFSPAMAIIGALLGVFAGFALGLQPLDITAFFSIVIAGGVIVMILKK